MSEDLEEFYSVFVLPLIVLYSSLYVSCIIVAFRKRLIQNEAMCFKVGSYWFP